MRHGGPSGITVDSVATERDMSYPRHEPHPLPSYPPGQPGSGRPSRPPRPPLTKRMRPGHWIAVDYAVGALAALFGLLATVHVQSASVAVPGGPGAVHSASVALVALPTRLVLAAAIFFPVALRRRHPVPAF